MSDTDDTTPPGDAELAEMTPANSVWPGSVLNLSIRLILQFRRSGGAEPPVEPSAETLKEWKEQLYLTGVEHWEEWVANWKQADSPKNLIGYLMGRLEEVLAEIEEAARLDPARLRGRTGPRYQ